MNFYRQNFISQSCQAIRQAGKYLVEKINHEITYWRCLKEIYELECEIENHSLPKEDFPYLNTRQLSALWRTEQRKKLIQLKSRARETQLDDEDKSRLTKIIKYFGLTKPLEED